MPQTRISEAASLRRRFISATMTLPSQFVMLLGDGQYLLLSKPDIYPVSSFDTANHDGGHQSILP
jgi:hypothetical protein